MSGAIGVEGMKEQGLTGPLLSRDSQEKVLNTLSHLPVSVKAPKCRPSLDTSDTFALSFGINFWKR